MISNEASPTRISQVSGITKAHEDENRSPIGGETLLSQYKQCSEINDRQLRDAVNIKDIVKIKVATVDKQLYMQNRHKDGSIKEETSYNLQFDPINFLQKVPCMGDREFIVNQSILHNSTAKNRVSEAVNRQKFMQQHRGSHSLNNQHQRRPP